MKKISEVKLVQISKELIGINFVITTTNLKRVKELIDNGHDVIEMIDKPFELEILF